MPVPISSPSGKRHDDGPPSLAHATAKASQTPARVHCHVSGPIAHRKAHRPSRNLRQAWHTSGMARTRLSTTVDAALLENARRLRAELTDAALIDEALEAFLAQHRAAETDASYAAYDRQPLDDPDAWGDLASFRRAAAAS
jgi:hypothetical protein